LIQTERMKARLDELNRIGSDRVTGGITRLGFTAAEREAHRLICSWFQDEKRVTARQDACGNTILRVEGDGRRSAIAIGSHVDSVINGGKYDGQAGVIAGLEVLSFLLENDVRLAFPFEVIIFSCEESSRFGVSTIGSKGMSGMLQEWNLDAYRDTAGISIGQAMAECGMDLSRLGEAERAPEELRLFLELHIEQGSVLEAARVPVGIATAISRPWRLRVAFAGRAAHSGSTPMHLRRNALLPAAEYVQFVEEKALEWSSRGHLVASVTTADLFPNNMNVIPEEVVLGVDIRSHKPGTCSAFAEEISARWQERWKEKWSGKGYGMKLDILVQDEPVPLDVQMVRQLEKECRGAGIPCMKLPSWAGHDSMNMASRFPTALVFVPSPGGISHHPEESIDEEGWRAGTELLLRTVLRENGLKAEDWIKEG
jgi:N-carbamoyl-L-amino-acid hydrolase